MITSLRVLGKSVTVLERAVKGDKDYGECDHAKAVLVVSPKQSEDGKRDTVLHELVHFIDEELQLRMCERTVRLLATGLLAVLRDNPSFVAYLVADA